MTDYDAIVKALREEASMGRAMNGIRLVTSEALDALADAIEESKHDLDFAIRAEAAAAKACTPRWISVEERLPDKSEQIADHWFSDEVIGKDEVTIRKAYYNITAGVWLDANCEMEWGSITHWMPMPPKEET